MSQELLPQMEPSSGQTAAAILGNALTSLWRHKSLFLFGIVCSVLVGTLYYFQTAPIYQAKASVLVVQKRSDNASGKDSRGVNLDDFVSTHQILIQSPIIIERAIQKQKLDQFSCFAARTPDQTLVEFVSKNLTVTRDRSSNTVVQTGANVLNLAFQGTNAEEAAFVLTAIIESYELFLSDTYRNVSEETATLIGKAKKVLEDDLKNVEVEYRKFRINSPVLIGKSRDGSDVRNDRLGNLDAKKSATLLRAAEIQSLLQTLDGAKTSTDKDIARALVMEWSRKLTLDGPDQRSTSVQDHLYPLLIEEQRLLESKGAKHPDMVALRERIVAARTFLTTPLAGVRAEASPGGLLPTGDPNLISRALLQQQLDYLKLADKEISSVYEIEHKKAREHSIYDIEDENFRSQIARSQQLYDTIIKRLQEVDLVRDAGGYQSKTIAPPEIGKKIKPSGLLILIGAMLVGVALGGGLVYLAVSLDTSFRSVDEIRDRLKAPIIGQIPKLKPASEEDRVVNGVLLDPMLVTVHRPRSVEAESYRGVRTSLYFGLDCAEHRVIQVTSPNGGDGKSTLISNLGVVIAQSGKRVLLIDADLRKPRQQDIFGIDAKRGLSTVISRQCTLSEAIQESAAVPGLSLLPCGPIPFNPAELLTSPRFFEVLNDCRDLYDFVLVDTPPILVVSDPAAVAPRVDGVILNVRMKKNARPAAERARTVLQQMGIKLLGVVVNDTTEGGGYGYGQSYGYGYTEGYHTPGDEKPASDETVVSGVPSTNNVHPR